MVNEAARYSEEAEFEWNNGDGYLQRREPAYCGRSSSTSCSTEVSLLDDLFILNYPLSFSTDLVPPT